MKISSAEAYKINVMLTERFCLPLIRLHYIPSYFIIKYPSRGDTYSLVLLNLNLVLTS